MSYHVLNPIVLQGDKGLKGSTGMPGWGGVPGDVGDHGIQGSYMMIRDCSILIVSHRLSLILCIYDYISIFIGVFR
jgi:hypothetical protein